MVMQEQKEPSKAKTGWKNAVWGGVALIIIAAALVGFWSAFSKLPKSEWRNASTALPWQVNGVKLDEVEAVWKNSAGDSRMELRAYCFPVCRMKLAQAQGEGQLTVRFLNSRGEQMGDRLYIAYKDGKFIPKENNSIHVTETEATVRLEDGFLTRDEYILHQFSQTEPLWRVQVGCRATGSEHQQMGYISILPNDL